MNGVGGTGLTPLGTGLTPLSRRRRTQATILLRATTQSSPLDSNTNLKKCQKSFSTCHGARFASMN
jgi:hypothetical protein